MKFEKVSFEEFKTAVKAATVAYVDYKKAYDELKEPKRGSKYSAGYDFTAPYDVVCLPGYSTLIPLGIKAEIDRDKVLKIYPRSSLGFKHGFRLLNTVGIIDSDYYNNPKNEGHIMIKFTVDERIDIKAGEKICQGLIEPFYTVDDDNADSERVGGMGSTGK